MDREKVIKGLNSCARTDGKYCGHCPYTNEGDCVAMLSRDVIALLKEQEAAEPKTGNWIWLQHCANEGVYCSECHTKMFDRYPMEKKLSQFCGHCGAKMGNEVGIR